MKSATALILAVILYHPGVYAGEETDKKAAYISEQIKLESEKFMGTVRGPVNALFTLYKLNPSLWSQDPLIRDRWIKNIDDLVVEGLISCRKLGIALENLTEQKDTDKTRTLKTASEYLNKLRVATQGLMKNITSMKLPPGPRVSRVIDLCRNEEIDNPNDLFLNLYQAEDRLNRLLGIRISLVEQILTADPKAFKEAPTAEYLIEQCCDLYLDPKIKCFAELKELVTRTDMSFDARAGAIARVTGYLVVASDAIEIRLRQLETYIPPSSKIQHLTNEAEKRR